MKGGLLLGLFSLIFFLPGVVYGRKTVEIPPETSEYFFTFHDIDYLEDPGGSLTFSEVSSPAFDSAFKSNTLKYPKNIHVSSVYWYRIRVRYSGSAKSRFLMEFYDQTIDHIDAFLENKQGQYVRHHAGARGRFSERLFRHKNFEFFAPTAEAGTYTYYFRLKSAQTVNVIIVHRTIERFIGYALSEYISFGFFYGMIIMFIFHNGLMYTVMKHRQYLFYILYILSVAMYEMSTDGIAFQYLWPDSPSWNEYAYATPLLLMGVFALLFTIDLLHVKTKAPRLYKLIVVVLVGRFIFYLCCWFINKSWFNYRVIEFVPLSVAFYTGIYIWKTGFKPARFFVLAYTFLFIGFVLKVLVVLGYGRFIPGPIAHYSMSFCFILEMSFLSFAIGDKVRLLKRKKEVVQLRIIREMEENARLKDSMNRELEVKVEERTHEIVEKTKEIQEKSHIIEQQNGELLSANKLLQEQGEEIARMNLLLQKDNLQLQTSIKKVTQDRVMSAEVDFEEFSKAYPDRESGFSLLADLKWKDGYRCRKCGNDHYCNGQLPYSRRCTRCRYDESVIAYTVLQNARIPINKAFYIIFLIYNSKGRISSHKLAEMTGIRQSTCWMYLNKIRKVMEERKKELRKAGSEGWSKLVLEY